MSILELNEAEMLPSKSFTLGSFSFPTLNPIQSAILPVINRPENCLVSVPTGTGKTEIGEMYLAQEIRENKGRGIYLSPLKSLSQEKYDKWTDKSSHFSDLNISICTGDYQITPSRKKELENSDLVIMTYEMLNSLSRSKSDKNDFLKKNITLVVDECHCIADEARGSHVEVGLLNFIKLNPNARVVGLSATMTNYKDIANWISQITKRDTYTIHSTYRPCKLNKVYENLKDKKMSYYGKEKNKISKAISIIEKYSKDKFILFVHGKKIGYDLLEALTNEGIPAVFHNADLDKEKRVKIENDFRNGDTRVVIATSTLSAGINMPAKRVIILGVHRGMSEIDVGLILQMAGRAGRPQYIKDSDGYAHILLPENKFGEWKHKIENPPPLYSTLFSEDYRKMSFHIVNEIHHRNIVDRDSLHEWFNVTLAAHQNKELDNDFVDGMMNNLKKKNLIVEEDGFYHLTALGKVSSIYYYDPCTVSDLAFNFNKLFNSGKEQDDHYLSMCLSNVDMFKIGISSKAENVECEEYLSNLNRKKVFYDTNNLASVKYGFVYYLLLKGKDNPVLSSTVSNIKKDFNRTMEVLNAIDYMHGKWDRGDWWQDLSYRMTYGISWDVVPLTKISGIGSVKAMKLWNSGIKSYRDISSNLEKVKSVLNCSDDVLTKIHEESQQLLLV